MKVALVCDWLTEIGGAEQVLKTLHEMFPDAPIYTSIYRHNVDKYFSESPRGSLEGQGNAEEDKPLKVRTGWLNCLPVASRRFVAPLRQHYFSHLDLTDYDLVISVTGCDAKFVKTRPGSHLCYCHVPTQYYWGKYDDYLKNPGFGVLNPVIRPIFKLLTPFLRKNDLKAASRPDFYVTISSYAASEIRKYYKREAKIIAPPVNTTLFQQLVENSTPKREIKHKKSQAKKSEQKHCSVSTLVENPPNLVRFLENNRGKYYINFSRQVNWKRLDLLIEACEKAQKPLILIGNGPEHKNLVTLAKKLEPSSSPIPNVIFLPAMPQENLVLFLNDAKAFLFPSEEPFGIAPVEALAAGCPVIALKKGGALDFIQEGKNGLFFESQTADSLIKALENFEKSALPRRNKPSISKTAQNFSETAFRKKMLKYIYEVQKNHPQ